MLSKNQIKHIRSLAQQKFRDEHRLFLVEGAKMVGEWLCSNQSIATIAGTESWFAANMGLVARHPEAECHVIKDTELETISTQPSPNQVLLVAKMAEVTAAPTASDWSIALDALRDPGNMGAVIRIADWFGIQRIICSADCADIYNPKVVQAAMGGHLRVKIYEADLDHYLNSASIPVFAATLDGENIYDVAPPSAGIIVIGNESKGIAPALQALATRKVKIPGRGGAESLNAAVATGILCALLVR